MGGIPSPRDESGFGLIELLISIVVLQIALLALVGAFGAGSVALGRAAKINTAAVLADQQMELYRSMPYDAIGLDTAAAPTTGTYIADTTVCPASQNPVCGNSGPVNNTNNSTWSCTAASGSSSVSTYFSANGINPCTAHRVVNGVSTPRSPDVTNLLRGHVHQVRHADRGATAGEAGLDRGPRGRDVEGACAHRLDVRLRDRQRRERRSLLARAFAKGRRVACR